MGEITAFLVFTHREARYPLSQGKEFVSMRACVQYKNIGIQQDYLRSFEDAKAEALRLYMLGMADVRVCQVYELSEIAEIGETTPLVDRMRAELEEV